MTGQSDASRFGAFGKIPSLGDFLRLNLPADFVRSWDDWLQAAMISARDRLGSRWDECYLSAPIWRFSLPADIAGRRAASGILMPSVDRVGRQYPLTLATTCPGGDTPLRHFANAALFEQLETIALAALDNDTGREKLAEELSSLLLKPTQPSLTQVDTYCGPTPPEQALAAKHISQTQGEVSIWSTRNEDDNHMLLCQGLPDAAQSIGLFDLTAPVWQAAPKVRTA